VIQYNVVVVKNLITMVSASSFGGRAINT